MKRSLFGVLVLGALIVVATYMARSGAREVGPGDQQLAPKPPPGAEEARCGTLIVDCKASRKGASGSATLILTATGGFSRSVVLPINVETTIEAISPGTYALQVSAPRAVSHAIQEITIGPGRPHRIEVPLVRQWSITGRLTTSNGRPVEKALLSIADVLEWSDVSLVDGRYVVKVPESDEGRLSWLSVRVPGFATAGRELTLRPDEDPPDLDFILVAGGRVRGTVLGPDSLPLRGVAVEIFSKDFRDRTTTDGAGRYELSSVSFGQETVSVKERGYLPVTKSVEVTPTAADQEVSFQLDKGWTVKGFVFDGANAPIPSARVTADDTSCQTDGRGYFEVSGVRPTDKGLIRVVGAEASGFGPASLFGVPPGQTVRFNLLRAVQLSVEIKNVPAACTGGVSLMVRRKDRAPSDQVQPDRSFTGLTAGIHAIDLTEGLYDITATAGGLTVFTRPGVALTSQPETITIDLAALDASTLARGEALDKQAHGLTSAFVKEAASLSQQEKQALWKTLQEKLKLLEAEKRTLESTIQR